MKYKNLWEQIEPLLPDETDLDKEVKSQIEAVLNLEEMEEDG